VGMAKSGKRLDESRWEGYSDAIATSCVVVKVPYVYWTRSMPLQSLRFLRPNEYCPVAFVSDVTFPANNDCRPTSISSITEPLVYAC